ncbi:glycoside hydrolase family 25 protein [Thermopolyspora sp. NPDC052614]|uniref:glycoside hydrolase family 25 protein n=1 Tax=Thermopolyspora sp. NPDC052614 TaxID=3155682 RepID=UPI003433AF90
MLKGIDVSNWQRRVDWRAHADRGVAFAFAKATEGDEFLDPWFERNWEGMREHWIVRGAYHFARPGGKNPEEQAVHFLRALRRAAAAAGRSGFGLRHGDLLALDLETNDRRKPHEVARFARRWCAAVIQLTGVRPFIYTHYAFAYDGHCEGLGVLPLWIAAPGRPKGDPLVPDPWETWTIHQYANSPVDKNVFDGTRGELTRYGKRRRRRGRGRYRGRDGERSGRGRDRRNDR